MRFTDWFDAQQVLPVRAGYYMVREKCSWGPRPTAIRVFYFDPEAPKDYGHPLFWFHHDGPHKGINFNCCWAERYEWCGLVKASHDKIAAKLKS